MFKSWYFNKVPWFYEKLSYEPQSFLSSILSDLSTIPDWRY